MEQVAVRKKKKKRRHYSESSVEEDAEQCEEVSIKDQMAQLWTMVEKIANDVAQIPKGDVNRQKEAQETLSVLNESVSRQLSPVKHSSPKKIEEPKSRKPLNESPKKVVSPKMSPKKAIRQTDGDILDTSRVTEELCFQELKILRERYDHQKEKCESRNLDFLTSKRGLRKLKPVMEAIKRAIGIQFQPKSEKDKHQFSENDADNIGQEFLEHCGELKERRIAMKALKTEQDGNCLVNCVSRALNGDLSQIHEIRLRASLYFLEFYQEIFQVGKRIGWANTVKNMMEPFERLSKDTEPLDSCGLFSISKALDCEIKVYWPTLLSNDKQYEYMSYCYNKETDTRYKLSILWASVKPPKSQGFQDKIFKADHFYLLANENFATVRSERLNPFSLQRDISDEDQAKDENNQENPFDGNSDDEISFLQEVKVTHKGERSKDAKEVERVTVSHKEEESKVDKAVKEVEEDKDVKVVEGEEEGEEDWLANIDVEILHRVRFLEYKQILEAAEKAKPEEILSDTKSLRGKSKSGMIHVVDFTKNQENHILGKPFSWSDFEGQWVDTHLDWQIYLPEGPNGELKQMKKMTYDKQNRKIVFRKKYGGGEVPQSRVVEALVMGKHSAAHGVDRNYKRKITAFMKVPSDMNPLLLNRCVYEYDGKFPGGKAHGNRKVVDASRKIETYIRSDPVTDEKMKKRASKVTPMRNYQLTIAEIAKEDGHELSYPRNPKKADNIKTIQNMNDPNYVRSGNLADQAERLWNTCVQGRTFIRRVAVDNSIGIPEIYIR